MDPKWIKDKIEELDKRLTALEARLDEEEMDKRLKAVEESRVADSIQLAGLEGRLNGLKASINKRLDALATYMPQDAAQAATRRLDAQARKEEIHDE